MHTLEEGGGGGRAKTETKTSKDVAQQYPIVNNHHISIHVKAVNIGGLIQTPLFHSRNKFLLKEPAYIDFSILFPHSKTVVVFCFFYIIYISYITFGFLH